MLGILWALTETPTTFTVDSQEAWTDQLPLHRQEEECGDQTHAHTKHEQIYQWMEAGRSTLSLVTNSLSCMWHMYTCRWLECPLN